MNTQEKIFNQVNDTFSEIYTEKGINYTKFSEFVINTLRLTTEEDRPVVAENLIFEILSWSTNNMYDAIGVIEMAKHNYFKMFDNAMAERFKKEEEDEDDE